jgi:hypothetical protein
MKRFNITKWEATTYNTFKEIEKAVAEFGIIGKKLKKIQPIGEVRVNIAYPIIRDQDYAFKLRLEEPTVFTFDDDSTFEVMMTGNGFLRISINTIPAGTINGITDSNFFPEKLLFNIINKDLLHVRPTEMPRSSSAYEFCFGDFSAVLATRKGYYTLSLRDKGNSYSLSGDRIIDSFHHRGHDRIGILPGGHSGGYHNFHIISAKHEKTTGIYPVAEESLHNYFDVIEEDTEGFLYPFLENRLTEAVQLEIYPEPLCSFDGFDYYGWNYYTFSQVKDMIAELRKVAELLETEQFDYIEPELYEYLFEVSHLGYNSFDSKEERIEFLKTCVPDFYERIALRLEKMIADAPEGFEHICVEGP